MDAFLGTVDVRRQNIFSREVCNSKVGAFILKF